MARGTHCVPTPLTHPRGQRSLTKYLPSEEMAMQRTWVPGGLPLSALLGSRDHMKFPSTLHAPWHQGEDRCC